MKVTNKHNLPQPIVRAVELSIRKPPKPGERIITVTGLIKPPRIVMLERLHWDELEIDVMDSIWSLTGTALHKFLDDQDETAPVQEERFRTTRDGWVISGQIDRLSEAGVLQDYKTTSVWSAIYGKPEWEDQLNLYAWLLRVHKYEVVGAEIIAFLRDWNRNGALKHDYPQNPCVTIPVILWPEVVVEHFVAIRLGRLDAAMVSLPDCTAEERWAKPDTWAVVKAGNKRADRVLNSEREAMDFVFGKPGKYEIQHRRGDSTRCRSYCSVSSVCSQWAKLKKELDNGKDNGIDDQGLVCEPAEAGQEVGVG